MRRYLYLILFFCATLPAFSKAPDIIAPVKKDPIIKIDSSRVNVRHFDAEALKAYSRQKEFQYPDMELRPSLWTRFWRWFWHLFDFLRPKKVPEGFADWFLLVLKYLFILVGVAAIVFVILKMAGIDALNIFRRKPLAASVPYSESLEDIHEIDFDAEIEKAAGMHNYRLAVRLLYLKCLKELSDATLIKWQPEKTNSAYIEELNDPGQRSAFRLLTHQFEYIWYGEFAIDAPVFKDINSMFQRFKSSIT